MKLTLRMVLALLVSVLIFVLSGVAVRDFVTSQVETRVRDLMLEYRAFHRYMQDDLHPAWSDNIAKGQISPEFYSKEMLSSSYIARGMQRYFMEERKAYGLPEVRYRIAAINPRNPINLATPFEQELIEKFNSDRELKSHSEVVEENGSKYLLLAQPFLVVEQQCLRCHGNPGDAQAAIRDSYSGEGGWNRKLGEVVAAEFVRSPLEGEFKSASIFLIILLVILFAGVSILFFYDRLCFQAEKKSRALEESERRFRTVLENLGGGVFVHDMEGRFLLVNDQACRNSGYSKEELLSISVSDLDPSSESSIGHAERWESLVPGKAVKTESEHVRKDGSTYPVELYLSRTVMGGKPAVLAVAYDVTAQKSTEEELRDSKAELEQIFESIPDAMVFSDLDRRITKVNSSFARIFGYEKEEIIGESARFLYAKNDDFETLGRIRFNKDAGELRNPYVVDYQRKDGVVFPGETVGIPARDGNENTIGYIGLIRDVSEKMKEEKDKIRLEQQLQQIQKLESIGRLAGGVAHDLNNMLSPILGYGEMLLEGLVSSEERKEFLEEMVSSGARARDLVQHLLAFSRRQVLEYKPLDLNRVLKDFEKLLRRTVPEDIEMVFELDEGLPSIKADTSQIEQVILNLAVNAADAMPEGGRIIFKTRARRIDHPQVELNAEIAPGDYVFLVVRDTGPGIEPEKARHIFEPFFSSKGEVGIGLGLSTVFGIIAQHGGHIQVKNDPEGGAVFEIVFPVAEIFESQGDLAGEPGELYNGDESILLVEDNVHIRSFAAVILQSRGYRVLSAADGESALEIIDSGESEIDLLLTDVVMPGMNGAELCQRVVERFPEIKVLYMSGYADTVISSLGLMQEGIHFLQKPFSGNDLVYRIRRLLDS